MTEAAAVIKDQTGPLQPTVFGIEQGQRQRTGLSFGHADIRIRAVNGQNAQQSLAQAQQPGCEGKLHPGILFEFRGQGYAHENLRKIIWSAARRTGAEYAAPRACII